MKPTVSPSDHPTSSEPSSSPSRSPNGGYYFPGEGRACSNTHIDPNGIFQWTDVEHCAYRCFHHTECTLFVKIDNQCRLYPHKMFFKTLCRSIAHALPCKLVCLDCLTMNLRLFVRKPKLDCHVTLRGCHIPSTIYSELSRSVA